MAAIPQAILDEVIALESKNVGLVCGFEQKNIALTGSGTSWKIPEEYLPVFPRSCVSLTAIAADVTVMDGDDEITVTDLDDEGNITLDDTATTPMATFVQEFEPYLAQGVKVDVKQDDKDVGRIRSDIKHKIYGAKSLTISQDHIIGDPGSLETLIQMAFDAYEGDVTPPDDVEVFEITVDPKELNAYVILEKKIGGKSTALGKMYFPNARAVLTTLIDVKEGDIPQCSIDIAVDTSPRIVRPKTTT